MTLSELYMGLSQASRMAELDTVSAWRFLGALGRLSDITTIRRAMARTEPCSFSAWHWYMPSSSGMIWLITSLLWKQTTRVFHYEKKITSCLPQNINILTYLTKYSNIAMHEICNSKEWKNKRFLHEDEYFWTVNFFALFL